MTGLNCRPKIVAIEFVSKRRDGKRIEEIGLGIENLTEEQKEHLKKLNGFGAYFDVLESIE